MAIARAKSASCFSTGKLANACERDAAEVATQLQPRRACRWWTHKPYRDRAADFRVSSSAHSGGLTSPKALAKRSAVLVQGTTSTDVKGLRALCASSF